MAYNQALSKRMHLTFRRVSSSISCTACTRVATIARRWAHTSEIEPHRSVGLVPYRHCMAAGRARFCSHSSHAHPHPQSPPHTLEGQQRQETKLRDKKALQAGGQMKLKDATTLAQLLMLLQPFEGGRSPKGVLAFRGVEAAIALNHLHRLRADALKDAEQHEALLRQMASFAHKVEEDIAMLRHENTCCFPLAVDAAISTPLCKLMRSRLEFGTSHAYLLTLVFLKQPQKHCLGSECPQKYARV